MLPLEPNRPSNDPPVSPQGAHLPASPNIATIRQVPKLSAANQVWMATVNSIKNDVMAIQSGLRRAEKESQEKFLKLGPNSQAAAQAILKESSEICSQGLLDLNQRAYRGVLNLIELLDLQNNPGAKIGVMAKLCPANCRLILSMHIVDFLNNKPGNINSEEQRALSKLAEQGNAAVSRFATILWQTQHFTFDLMDELPRLLQKPTLDSTDILLFRCHFTHSKETSADEKALLKKISSSSHLAQNPGLLQGFRLEHGETKLFQLTPEIVQHSSTFEILQLLCIPTLPPVAMEYCLNRIFQMEELFLETENWGEFLLKGIIPCLNAIDEDYLTEKRLAILIKWLSSVPLNRLPYHLVALLHRKEFPEHFWPLFPREGLKLTPGSNLMLFYRRVFLEWHDLPVSGLLPPRANEVEGATCSEHVVCSISFPTKFRMPSLDVDVILSQLLQEAEGNLEENEPLSPEVKTMTGIWLLWHSQGIANVRDELSHQRHRLATLIDKIAQDGQLSSSNKLHCFIYLALIFKDIVAPVQDQAEIRKLIDYFKKCVQHAFKVYPYAKNKGAHSESLIFVLKQMVIDFPSSLDPQLDWSHVLSYLEINGLLNGELQEALSFVRAKKRLE